MVLDTSKKTTWDESEVEWVQIMMPIAIFFFWPKIKERKAPVAQGKQASKHKSICAAALDDFISLS